MSIQHIESAPVPASRRLTKQQRREFTAAAVAQLAEAGDLDPGAAKRARERQQQGDIQPDTDSAVDYLRKYARLVRVPAINLVEIHPEYKEGEHKPGVPAPKGNTFQLFDAAGAELPEGINAMRRWIDDRQGALNLYHTVNMVRNVIRKKPLRSDLKAAVALFADLDPDPDIEKAKGLDAARDELKQRLAEIEAIAPPIVISSGNGLNLIWPLDQLVPLDAKLIETEKSGKKERHVEPCPNTIAMGKLGRRLALRFGGDKVQNTDRLLRIPGTINQPNAKKLEKGRKPVLASLVAFPKTKHSQADLRRLTMHNLPGLDLLDDELRGRLTPLLEANDELFGRWLGDGTGLQDKSRSGFALSLRHYLKDFSADEFREIAEACPSTTGTDLSERQIDRMSQRIQERAAPEPEESGAEVFDDDDETEEGSSGKKQSVRTLLVQFQHEIKLWRDNHRKSYATVTEASKVRQLAIAGPDFRDWLLRRFMERYGGAVPAGTAIREAISAYEALASLGPTCHARIRTAQDETTGLIYIDLGDDTYRCAEITPQGWAVIDTPPDSVKLIRPRGMRPLPTPVTGGDIAELRRFINTNDDDFKLLVAAMVADLMPVGPYPILLLAGGAGSSKTTASRVVGRLIDPNECECCAPPKDTPAIKADASNAHLVSYDNLSTISGDMSDDICRLSTGGAIGGRALYTDSERAGGYYVRPVLINSVKDLAWRSDFVSRSIPITLLPIINGHMTETEFYSAYDAAKPAILGRLLDGVVAALRDAPAMAKRFTLPRMADFSARGAACFPAFGWEPSLFMQLYASARLEAADKLSAEDEVSQAILAMAHEHRAMAELMDISRAEPVFRGTATKLLALLRSQIEASDDATTVLPSTLPKDGTRLGGHLRRAMTTLKELGVLVDPDGPRRTITIKIDWRSEAWAAR